jgi:hypothetical protein
MKWFLPLLACCSVLGGCIASHFYSTLNPRYAGMQYQRILVQFVEFQPDLARAGEQDVQSQIETVVGNPVQCYAYTQIPFPPGCTQQQMKAEIWKYEVENKIDATLVCFNARRIQNSEQNKDMYCRLELFDLRTSQSVWYSQSTLDTNNILYSFNDMIQRFVQETVQDLNAKGLLGVDNRPTFTPGSPAAPPGTNL